jgi:hypothetical protein
MSQDIHFTRGDRVEVPCTKHGKLSYRWTTGWHMVVDGKKLYPPMCWTDVNRICQRDGIERRIK